MADRPFRQLPRTFLDDKMAHPTGMQIVEDRLLVLAMNYDHHAGYLLSFDLNCMSPQDCAQSEVLSADFPDGVEQVEYLPAQSGGVVPPQPKPVDHPWVGIAMIGVGSVTAVSMIAVGLKRWMDSRRNGAETMDGKASSSFLPLRE